MFHNIPYANHSCRRPIEKSPLAPIEMTLSPVFESDGAKAFRRCGVVALVSRRRGKPSNRAYPAVLRTEVIGIIRERYADFGPTLAGGKLAELHGIHLGRETIRQWMMAAELWKDRRQRLRPVHQPRYRRDCIGELIQIDCSRHCWF